MKNLIKFCVDSYTMVGKALFLVFTLQLIILTYGVLVVTPLELACDYRQYWAILLYLITIPLCKLLWDKLGVLFSRGGFIYEKILC